MWKVYVASSWTFRQSRFRAGAAVLTGDGRERVLDTAEDRDNDESSEGVGARRTIFLFRSVLRRSSGLGNGALRRPSFGVIINF